MVNINLFEQTDNFNKNDQSDQNFCLQISDIRWVFTSGLGLNTVLTTIILKHLFRLNHLANQSLSVTKGEVGPVKLV